MGRIKKEKTKYTEELIQQRLGQLFLSQSNVKYICENLFVFDWESDLLLITRSNIIYEFEIKVSKADFKNDFKHKKDKHIILEGEERYGDKYIPKYYEHLETSKKYGEWSEKSFHKYNDDNPHYLVDGHMRPTYFYYAVPENLIEESEVPEYAGLVYMMDVFPYFKIIKTAPKINKEKYSDNELNLVEKFYFNYRSWKEKAVSEKENINVLKEEINTMTNKSPEDKKSYSDLKKECDELKEKYQITKEYKEHLFDRIAQLEKDASWESRYTHYLKQILKENNIPYKKIWEDFDG